MKNFVKWFAFIIVVCIYKTNTAAQLLLNADLIVTPTTIEPQESPLKNVNTTSHNNSPFNLFRSEMLGLWGISEIFSVRANALFDTKMKNRIRFDGVYLEGKPDSVFNFRVGKIPTTFGNFVSRRFARENTLIGFPLMYSFKTPLFGNDVDTNISQVLFRKQQYDSEIIALNEAVWIQGISVLGSMENFRYAFSLSNSSLANPNVKRKYGNQYSGRISSTLSDNLEIGISSALGSYLDKAKHLPSDKKIEDVKQKIYGADVRYEYWRYEFLGEVMQITYDVPLLPQKELTAKSWYAELRYQYSRTILLSARVEQFLFSDVDSFGTSVNWGNSINRWEMGIRYRYADMFFKGVWQRIEFSSLQESLLDIYALQIIYRWEDIFKAM